MDPLAASRGISSVATGSVAAASRNSDFSAASALQQAEKRAKSDPPESESLKKPAKKRKSEAALVRDRIKTTRNLIRAVEADEENFRGMKAPAKQCPLPPHGTATAQFLLQTSGPPSKATTESILTNSMTFAASSSPALKEAVELKARQSSSLVNLKGIAFEDAENDNTV